ncbi:MAG: DNA mismatch repair protein MutS [Candidatus Schekmanbacteria bacterium]|nr:DNA mismatch repair protein MutS [Candidatus Schekmanbacteria bacterium]
MSANAGPESFAPHAQYAKRLAAQRLLAERAARKDAFIAHARMAVALAGAGMVALVWKEAMHLAWLLIPIAAFLALVVKHDRVIRARRRAARRMTHYEEGLARLEERWMGRGVQGESYRDAAHPYAEDLDLFGAGSLFELLATTRTRAGEDTLAAWLLTPAPPEEIRARQAAVAELRPRLDLREDLAVLGSDLRSALDPSSLTAWGTRETRLVSPATRALAPLLVALTIAAAGAWRAGLGGPEPLLIATGLQLLYAHLLRRRVRRIVAEVERPARDLGLLVSLLQRIERETFVSPRLAALRAALDTAGMPPSRRVRSLHRRLEALDLRRNQLFAPAGAALLWTTQVALAIEAWQGTYGPAAARWLKTLGEIEALAALSGYAYEHPQDPFPEITAGPAIFDSAGIGHPLLPETRCVRNDVRLGAGPRLLIVSGSNMSGKSTLLRALGTNVVLALAGAPVRARSLRLSPLAIGASIRLHDSLQQGTSRFYAEITRLHQIVELTSGEHTVLSLLDEILHGTNSHDRLIGAQAVVRTLVEKGALGVVTTHDLALARIAEELGPIASNVCFEDHLENGRMRFDYVMRPGVVTKSNALELMRAIGLEV